MSNPTVPLLSTLKWFLDFHDFLAKNLPFKASISSELIKEESYFGSFLQYLIVNNIHMRLVDFLFYFPGIFTPAWAPLKAFFSIMEIFQKAKNVRLQIDFFFLLLI